MRSTITLCFAFLGIVSACGDSAPGAPFVDDGGDSDAGLFGGRSPRPDAGPDLDGGAMDEDAGTRSDGDPPLYLLLFAHTEDPFNHEHSEERYRRIVPMLERLAEEYPDADLSWLVQFQGSDALTVAERNETTGVADLLRNAADLGLVVFGYHGQHDATYSTKPMTFLDESSTFAEMALAVDDWITCRRSVTTGACLEPDAGGVLAIESHFGPVEVVTGLSLGRNGAPMELDPGQHAVARYLPDQLVGYGFPDHGGLATPEFQATVAELMAMLTPADNTSPSVFWSNGGIKINDGAIITNGVSRAIDDGPDMFEAALSEVDRTRPHVMNAGLGSKYIYTASGWSPTIYGYAHRDAPELPPEGLLSESEIEANYAATEATLEYIASIVSSGERAIEVVRPSDIVQHLAPADYWEITQDELDVLVDDLLAGFGGAPPSYAFDGSYYYSLREVMGLLAMALVDDDVATRSLPSWFGPFEEHDGAAQVSVSRSSVSSLANEVYAQVTAATDPWQATPANLMSPSYSVGGHTLSAAQALYALATEYVARRRSSDITSIGVLETEPSPETIELLRELNALDAVGTAWSLKPAVIR